MTTYRHTEDMGEISGFGGGYEEVCQQMLENGCKWLEENKNPELTAAVPGNENIKVFGILIPESDDAKALEDAVMEGVGDATGAMHHAVMNRLFWIAKNGWDAYCVELRKAA
jgi:hypothetical protein